jgi:integrase/recombinase XerD
LFATTGALVADVRPLRTATGRRSWTVVDERGIPIPADDFLAYLGAIEQSPNTQRAYAHDLKHFFTYLADSDLSYTEVTGEDLAYFVQYLRRPAPDVPFISEAAAARRATSVNRTMAGVGSFYRFLGDRDDLPTAARLARQAKLARRPGFLDGIARHRPESPVIGPRLRPPGRALEVLTVHQARGIIDACYTLRDRWFFSLLFTTGMRRGQALGLRHADIDTRERNVVVVPREDNDNGARPKSRKAVTMPLSRDMCRLYLDYMHGEYGDIDSDYVFINLRGPRRGQALTDQSVDALVRRLRARVGFGDWSCHTFRHTWATLHYRAGMRIEVISHLLTHCNLSTTATIYTHLNVDDMRQELVRHGCWEDSA